VAYFWDTALYMFHWQIDFLSPVPQFYNRAGAPAGFVDIIERRWSRMPTSHREPNQT